MGSQFRVRAQECKGIHNCGRERGVALSPQAGDRVRWMLLCMNICVDMSEHLYVLVCMDMCVCWKEGEREGEGREERERERECQE